MKLPLWLRARYYCRDFVEGINNAYYPRIWWRPFAWVARKCRWLALRLRERLSEPERKYMIMTACTCGDVGRIRPGTALVKCNDCGGVKAAAWS